MIWGEAAQREKCYQRRKHVSSKCNRVVARPSERKRCREVAEMASERIDQLADEYRDKMSNVVDQCTDRELTDEELARCRRMIASASQEFMAQCEASLGAVTASFGDKTVAARARELRRKLTPGRRTSSASMTSAYRQMLQSWKRSCEGIQGQTKAMGMQDFTLVCDDLRGASDEEIDRIARNLPSYGSDTSSE